MFTADGGRSQQFIDVTVVGRGQFVAYCSKRPMHVYLDGIEGIVRGWVGFIVFCLHAYQSMHKPNVFSSSMYDDNL